MTFQSRSARLNYTPWMLTSMFSSSKIKHNVSILFFWIFSHYFSANCVPVSKAALALDIAANFLRLLTIVISLKAIAKKSKWENKKLSGITYGETVLQFSRMNF